MMKDILVAQKVGRPRKWIEPKKWSIYVGANELEEITKAAKATGESLNSFLVNCALDRVAEMKAAEMRKTYSKSSERPANAGA